MMSLSTFLLRNPRSTLLLSSLFLFIISCAPRLAWGWSPENKWHRLQPGLHDVPQLDKGHHHVSGSVIALAGNSDIRLHFLPAGEPVPAAAQVVAQATFVDSLHTKSNFGKLRVVAKDDQHVGHELRYRAAGFAEGFLTAGAIWDHFRNTRDYFKTDLYPGVDIWDKPMKWLHEQEAWVMQQLAARTGSLSDSTPLGGSSSSSSSSSSSGGSSGSGTSSEGPSSSSTGESDAPHAQLWRGVALQMAQFNGVVEGYAARRQEALRLLQGQPACSSGGGGGGGGARSVGAGAGSREGAACAHHENVPGPMSRDDHLFLQNNGELYDIVDGLLAGAWGGKAGADMPGSVHGSRSSSSSSSRWRWWAGTLPIQRGRVRRAAPAGLPTKAHRRRPAAAAAAAAAAAKTAAANSKTAEAAAQKTKETRRRGFFSLGSISGFATFIAAQDNQGTKQTTHNMGRHAPS
uniref:Phospholipase B-like n=1 Tax=Dunaliella tertiolecta TaxID=3047 RepID=A0A6S8P5A5_DUNTE